MLKNSWLKTLWLKSCFHFWDVKFTVDMSGLYPVLYPLVLHVSTVACAIYVHCSILAPGAHSTAPSVSNASGGSNRLMALCCSCLSFRAHLASICSCVFGALQMCLYDKFRSCEILPQFGHATRTFNASLGLVKSTFMKREYVLPPVCRQCQGLQAPLDVEAEDDSDAVLPGDRRCIPLCISLSSFNDNLRSSCDDGDDLFCIGACTPHFLLASFACNMGM